MLQPQCIFSEGVPRASLREQKIARNDDKFTTGSAAIAAAMQAMQLSAVKKEWVQLLELKTSRLTRLSLQILEEGLKINK